MLSIEPLGKEHLADVQRYASDIKISATTYVPHPYPENGAQIFFEECEKLKAEKKRFVFAIMQDNQFCGLMTLNEVDLREQHANLDYWIAVPFWNSGIATQAAKIIIVFAGSTLNLKNLFSGCLARNPGSQKILEKSGFTKIKEMTLEKGKFSGELFFQYQLVLEDPHHKIKILKDVHLAQAEIQSGLSIPHAEVKKTLLKKFSN